MGVHRNIDANFLRGVMPKVPSKKHPYENFGMPYVFLWILHRFECNCGYRAHSDLNAGRNLQGLGYRLVTQGPDVNRPDATLSRQ